jgi:hypothetical protein
VLIANKEDKDMARVNKYELRYVVNGQEKVIRFDGDDKKQKNLDACKRNGYRVVSCKKLYPFSTMKNQHNFDLIHSICFNTMHDMESGEIEWNDAEYEKLMDMRQKAEEFFTLPLPVAWLTWEDYKDAKELAETAIMHRQDACIRNGRPDLVTYC